MLRPIADVDAWPVSDCFQSSPSDGATQRPAAAAAAAALCHIDVISIIIIIMTSYDDVIIARLIHIGATCYISTSTRRLKLWWNT